MNHALGVLVVSAAALLGGCSVTGNTFQTGAIHQLVVGRTTLAQASDALGAQPTDTWQQGDTLLARWGYRGTAATDAVYFRQVVWLRFGPDGTLMRLERGVNLPLNAHPRAPEPGAPVVHADANVQGFQAPASTYSSPSPVEDGAAGDTGDMIYIPGNAEPSTPAAHAALSAAGAAPTKNPLLAPGTELVPGPVYPVR